MYRLLSKLIVYRNIEDDSILFRIADICKQLDTGSYDADEQADLVRNEIHRLLDLATNYGFDHNLWHNYLAYLLAMTETPFTLVAEKAGEIEGSVKEFVLNDFELFRKLFAYDFSDLEQKLEMNCFTVIQNYKAVPKKTQSYNRNVSIRIQELSRMLEDTASTEEFYREVVSFYQKYGVGQFGMNKAFRVATRDCGALLVPIIATSNAHFDDIVGYERQKEELRRNTEAFLAGKPANNVLLYGDAGTGKSTSIKALLNTYYEQGLRVIEVYKHEFRYLPDIIGMIKGRNYRFIIYMDDLSFESCETEYKYLKAVIEGDLEVRPENVLIYATSNRRHLLRETFSDRKEIDEEDIHRSETMAERMSLYNRFGVTIGYFKPEREEYFNIVKTLAQKYPQLDADENELLKKADVWALQHGEMSGRMARQFVDHIIGQL